VRRIKSQWIQINDSRGALALKDFQMKRSISAHLAVLVLLLVAGHDALAEDLAARERAAREATMSFVKELGGTLKRELASGDPAGAIRVCSEVAPGIANRISLANGWRVTRVGTRVRNAMLGTPDAWEQRVLAQFAKRAGAGEDYAKMDHSEIVEEPAGRYFRYMKAIGTQPLCLTCHGDEATIPPKVAETLAELYPHDRATGYAPGELRGAVSIKQPLDH